MNKKADSIFDVNGDGKVTKEEKEAVIEALHDMMDEEAEKAEKETKPQ